MTGCSRAGQASAVWIPDQDDEAKMRSTFASGAVTNSMGSCCVTMCAKPARCDSQAPLSLHLRLWQLSLTRFSSERSSDQEYPSAGFFHRWTERYGAQANNHCASDELSLLPALVDDCDRSLRSVQHNALNDFEPDSPGPW